MKKIALAPNPLKPEAVKLAADLAVWLSNKQVGVSYLPEVAELLGRPGTGSSDDCLSDADMLMVLGGDGTMLRWARLAAPKGTPVIGVNFGKYGFITEVHPERAQEALEKILAGNYYISERVVLEATLEREGTILGTYHALNDVVVSKGPLGRMLGLDTYVDDKFIVTYAADGLIVATPTGSTAYSLSAGGPVVHPNVSVLILTPICPHTLNARSLVVPDSGKVQIVGECGSDSSAMMLTIDGQHTEYLVLRDKVQVRKADFTAKLVQLSPQSFYDKLQTRLRWGERIS